ncbi:MAG: sulfatase [Bacteroidota bacterium]
MSHSATLLFLLSVFGLSCSPSLQQAASDSNDRPNILFIMADDHTGQAWGIYEDLLKAYVKNDNIQRLAQEGTVLDRAFCTNSICVPSRASIMTGQYSHRNDIYTLKEGLHPDRTNIAKVMQGAGYQTAIIGKWHLKQEPSGFDHYMVLPGQGRYHNPKLKTKDNWQDGNKGGTDYEGYSADVIGDHSVEWLKSRESDKPFFLMTHFKATHGPFDFPERYRSLNADRELPEPESLMDFGPETTGRHAIGQKLEEMGRRMESGLAKPNSYWGQAQVQPFSLDGLDSIAARRKIYQTMTKHILRGGAAIDDNIGKLLDYLDEAGLAENTVVIYTADQGYFLGEHGFFDKRMMYEESLRMPFVIRYPREIPAGKRNDDIILNVDFPALFADYAGVETPKFIQGRSFRENLTGNSPKDWRTAMYYRYWLHETFRPAHFGIRHERYKLIFYYGQGLGKPGTHQETVEPAWELYDLELDPNELENRYGSPHYELIVADLKRQLRWLRQELGDTDEAYPVMQQILDEHWE